MAFPTNQLMDRVPRIGEFIGTQDVEVIYEAVAQRRKNFPDEPEIISLTLVLMNIGDRYTPVECQEGEWVDVKMNVPPFKDQPRCPNGHTLTKGLPLKLAWLSA